MLGIYLVVTIFTQFSPQHVWAMTAQGPAELEVEFSELNGIATGSPVLARGQLVGTVAEIGAGANLGNELAAETSGAVRTATAATTAERGYKVSVKIAPRFRSLIRRGTIALIKSPLSAARVEPETVVELLIPRRRGAALLGQGETIKGYSSFEEFWSSDLKRQGVDLSAFSAPGPEKQKT